MGMEFTKIPASAWEQIQINSGIMAKSFNPETRAINGLMGAQDGGISFNPNPEYEDFGEDLDNVPANTWQLKRIKGYDPTLAATFKTMTAEMAKAFMGAADFASGSTTHIIPRSQLKESDFDDVWVIGDYSTHNSGATAGFVAVHLKHALNTTGFQWQTQKDGKGAFAVEFHGHYDLNDIDDVPFEIYVVTGTAPALTALTVTSAGGTASGDSNITVSGYTLGSGEKWMYKTAESTAPSVSYGDTISDGWTQLTSGSDITPASGHTKIAVVAVNSAGKAVAYGSATLVINS